MRTAPLNHPGGATGYRIDYHGRSFAFITDTEHVPGKMDRNVAKLIQDVDLFAYDASFTDAELPDFAGYGHSTWEEGLRLRKVANAGAMLAMHHMPFRTDPDIDVLEKLIQRSHSGSGVAREGMTIRSGRTCESRLTIGRETATIRSATNGPVHMRALNRKTLLVILAAVVAVVAAWNWRVADPKILRSLRDITFDNYQRIKPREPLGQPIRIVNIDEASIRRSANGPGRARASRRSSTGWRAGRGQPSPSTSCFPSRTGPDPPG